MKRRAFPGIDARSFLRRHWQKKPLLVRNALREYAPRITRADLFALAMRGDIESRIVAHARGRWSVRHGPFTRRDFERMPRSGWTLLVQGVDHALEAASRLLREFSFIPYARLDDVMVSYAAPGGGVGPHVDTYDVFLVQGSGQRCWRVARPGNREVVNDAPIKVLRELDSEDEWLVEPGDVLYLPPHWAHEGVAIGECITCSVGFRAPGSQELASRFLEFLQDALDLDGLYSDPDLQPTRNPGRIDGAMLERLRAVLERIRWTKTDADRFIGGYLSEPKPNVVFAKPARPLTAAAFARAVRERGVKLALATRMLYYGRWIFMNGEAFEAPADAAVLRTLADARTLPPASLDADTRQFLYHAYIAGHIEIPT